MGPGQVSSPEGRHNLNWSDQMMSNTTIDRNKYSFSQIAASVHKFVWQKFIIYVHESKPDSEYSHIVYTNIHSVNYRPSFQPHVESWFIHEDHHFFSWYPQALGYNKPLSLQFHPILFQWCMEWHQACSSSSTTARRSQRKRQRCKSKFE